MLFKDKAQPLVSTPQRTWVDFKNFADSVFAQHFAHPIHFHASQKAKKPPFIGLFFRDWMCSFVFICKIPCHWQITNRLHRLWSIPMI